MSTLLLLLTLGASAQTTEPLNDTIILISIDGARHDYLDLHHAPTLRQLAAAGLQASHLQPVFPTKTFTNHYSLVTGLYPAKHGIVDNNMYDPPTGMRFSLGNREQVQNPYWWDGEPIWVTAVKQGQVSATFFFPGSEAPVQGISPTYWFTYDESISNRQRVNTVLDWLARPAAERPQMITLYFSDVDTAGHNFGPESEEVRQALAHVDGEIGFLVQELQVRGLLNQINLMITSDHGMATVDLNQHIIIDEAFDTELAEQILYSRELVSIFPAEGKSEQLLSQLRGNLPAQAAVYSADTVPARFHFSGHERIAPILVLAEPGWAMLRRSWLEGFERDGTLNRIRGGHGYDNTVADMQGLFIAHGPAFRSQTTIGSIRMIDLYNVMANILKLEPAANDGDLSVVPLLLKP